MIRCLAAAVAAAMAGFAWKSRSAYLRLPLLPRTGAGLKATVTVIIPARNEERNISRAVQSFPGVPVIVVDDDSSDRTAERAAAAGARVLTAPPLKAGTLGKPGACAAGAAEAKTEWLLFVDADTWYAPVFLASLLAYCQREDLEAASVFLRQERITFFERLLLPYAFALYFCGVSPKQVNSPRRGSEALANGQCFLFSRAAYEAIGGHAAVCHSVVEDVMLASLAKQHGVAIRLLRAEELGAVRMYEGLPQIWRGFEKNSFRFFRINPWTGVQVVAASIVFTSHAPVLGLLCRDRHYRLAALFYLLPAILLRPWYGTWWQALAAPLAVYLFQAIALSGMWTTLRGQGAVWKGRPV